MGIEDFFITPATIINPGVKSDRYHNDVDDWDHATEVESTGWLQDLVSRRPRLGRGAEVLDGRDTVVSSHQWFTWPDAQISAFSRLRIDGLTFLVDGAPTTTRTPEGPHHLEVQLHLIDDVHQGALS